MSFVYAMPPLPSSILQPNRATCWSLNPLPSCLYLSCSHHSQCFPFASLPKEHLFIPQSPEVVAFLPWHLSETPRSELLSPGAAPLSGWFRLWNMGHILPCVTALCKHDSCPSHLGPSYSPKPEVKKGVPVSSFFGEDHGDLLFNTVIEIFIA